MKHLRCLSIVCCLPLALSAQRVPPSPLTAELLQVKRIYVMPLSGGASSDELRDLIISGIDGTKLFILTDNPDRADATLKGAAEDHVYVDIHDSSDGISTRQSGGKSGSSGSSSRGLLGLSISDTESHHTDEHKHEAYASVRLCNKDGDVIWSTTQESLGAKFKGASADVAAKIARQLALDVNRAHLESQSATTAAAAK